VRALSGKDGDTVRKDKLRRLNRGGAKRFGDLARSMPTIRPPIGNRYASCPTIRVEGLGASSSGARVNSSGVAKSRKLGRKPKCTEACCILVVKSDWSSRASTSLG